MCVFVTRSSDSIRSREANMPIELIGSNSLRELTGRGSLAEVALGTVDDFSARNASRQRPLMLFPLRFCVSCSLSAVVVIVVEGDLSKSC
jgi:hypothetical protein